MNDIININEKTDRLKPTNKGNARLMYIEGDVECDICDEQGSCAIIDSLGGEYSRVNVFCKKCIEEILKRFDHE